MASMPKLIKELSQIILQIKPTSLNLMFYGVLISSIYLSTRESLILFDYVSQSWTQPKPMDVKVTFACSLGFFLFICLAVNILQCGVRSVHRPATKDGDVLKGNVCEHEWEYFNILSFYLFTCPFFVFVCLFWAFLPGSKVNAFCCVNLAETSCRI